MAWPNQYIEVQKQLEDNTYYVWRSATEIGRLLGWGSGKTNYWLGRMVKDYWLIWRWHPRRYGWLATRQYALPWVEKAGARKKP